MHRSVVEASDQHHSIPVFVLVSQHAKVLVGPILVTGRGPQVLGAVFQCFPKKRRGKRSDNGRVSTVRRQITLVVAPAYGATVGGASVGGGGVQDVDNGQEEVAVIRLRGAAEEAIDVLRACWMCQQMGIRPLTSTPTLSESTKSA